MRADRRQKKNVRFQIKTDTCGRGLKEIAIYIWALYDGLRKSHATFLVACVADSLNLGTDRYFFEGGGGGGKFSHAAPAVVIWLYACVRNWPYRRVV